MLGELVVLVKEDLIISGCQNSCSLVVGGEFGEMSDPLLLERGQFFAECEYWFGVDWVCFKM